MLRFLQRWWPFGRKAAVGSPAPASPQPALTGIPEIDVHIREAEAAYDRMYDSIHPTSVTAAYSDMKESFAMAIQRAEERGLKEKAEELQKRRDHCQEVYRRQGLY